MLNSPPMVAENTASYVLDKVLDKKTRAVKLFRNGANQAVRIPKEFELPGQDAVMYRQGNTLVIEPVLPQAKKGTLAALAAALQAMKDLEPVAEPFPPFPDAQDGLLPLDDIAL